MEDLLGEPLPKDGGTEGNRRQSAKQLNEYLADVDLLA